MGQGRAHGNSGRWRPSRRWLPAGAARAANGAYAVDAADIAEAGSCKVESWLSAATNTDFSAVANPSCVVNLFRPVELSMQTIRARSDGEWSTTLAPKAKTNIVPTGDRKTRLFHSMPAARSTR